MLAVVLSCTAQTEARSVSTSRSSTVPLAVENADHRVVVPRHGHRPARPGHGCRRTGRRSSARWRARPRRPAPPAAAGSRRGPRPGGRRRDRDSPASCRRCDSRARLSPRRQRHGPRHQAVGRAGPRSVASGMLPVGTSRWNTPASMICIGLPLAPTTRSMPARSRRTPASICSLTSSTKVTAARPRLSSSRFSAAVSGWDHR